ncbi:DNA-binding NarL/FixJ family response regulator [Skermanella aerolata]|uniref:response regulator n=1 Tax=Skermanella aerolata TaxID=393310 RepID=UPI003D2577B5
MKLLILEDYLLVAWALRQLVTMDLNHVVTGIATNPAAALRLALDTDPDLALVDIRLENNTSGVDAARDLWLTCGVPSVFLTAYRNDAIPVPGAVGCLLKPYNQADIRLMLDAAEVILAGGRPDPSRLPGQFILYGPLDARNDDDRGRGHDGMRPEPDAEILSDVD